MKPVKKSINSNETILSIYLSCLDYELRHNKIEEMSHLKK